VEKRQRCRPSSLRDDRRLQNLAACFCATRFAGRTARSTATGASSRTAGCRAGGRLQRQVLYLGEINDSQKAAWCRTIEAFDEAGQDPRQIALFPEDRPAPVLDCDVVHVRLSGLRLHRPRSGAPAGWPAICGFNCGWMTSGRPRLPASRQGTRWLNVLKTLVTYRLVDPAASGGCIAVRTRKTPSATCWARISPWPARTTCTGV